MAYEQIRVEREGGVTRITLNRPDKLNALTHTMSDELVDAFTTAGTDEAVRCIVLTGEGRGFCAGQDLSEFADAYATGGRPDIEEHLAETYHKLIPVIVETPRPVIAAVNGVAAGAGVSLALAADIRVASEDARFIQAFVNIGLVPDSGGTHLLIRAIGMARAMDMSLTGEKVDARTALEYGLVTRTYPADTFAKEADTLAQKLASMPTAALAATKKLLQEAVTLDLREALDREAVAQSAMGKTEDHLEGVRAFAEKREPRFTGG